ncbi:hypothetical protein NIES3804_10560 [Microcystis aeruginosa NIES-3804]|uniref:Uncharacterized protein n=1 Tax=Microcystis aeruginosa NIES-3804 TaxID=2517783 RepID=A0A6H9G2J7_MICAE|nr:hypothetical protein NIES3804_10560 [Microcystis aeruginosa NIES-3804]
MKFPVTLYQDEEGLYIVECPSSVFKAAILD